MLNTTDSQPTAKHNHLTADPTPSASDKHGESQEQTQSINTPKHHISGTERVLTNLLSGAVAGGVAKTVIAPLDRTKIYFQTRNIAFSFGQVLVFLRKTYLEHGFFNLWRGNSATLVRILPYASIQYASHEQFKHILHVDTFAQKKAHPERSFIAGSLAGVVSTSATYPLDLARARMAVYHQYTGVFHVFLDMVKREGIISVYRGYWPTVLGIVPYAGTTFFTYETCKRYHHDHYKGREPNTFERLAFGAFAGIIGQSASYPLDIVRRRMQTRSEAMYNTATGTISHVLKEEGFIRGFYKGLSLNWIKGPVAVGTSFTVFDLLQKWFRNRAVQENVTESSAIPREVLDHNHSRHIDSNNQHDSHANEISESIITQRDCND